LSKKRHTKGLNLSRSSGLNNDNLKQWEQRGGRRQHPGRDVGLDQAGRRGQGEGDHQHHHLRRIPHRREEAISVQQRGKVAWAHQNYYAWVFNVLRYGSMYNEVSVSELVRIEFFRIANHLRGSRYPNNSDTETPVLY